MCFLKFTSNSNLIMIFFFEKLVLIVLLIIFSATVRTSTTAEIKIKVPELKMIDICYLYSTCACIMFRWTWYIALAKVLCITLVGYYRKGRINCSRAVSNHIILAREQCELYECTKSLPDIYTFLRYKMSFIDKIIAYYSTN